MEKFVRLQNAVSYVVLDLQFEESRCLLGGPGLSEVALLNTKDFEAFSSWQKDAAVRLEALIPWTAMLQVADQRGWIRGGAVLSTDINLYGSSEYSSRVASELGKASFFLQDPECLPEGKLYENPQWLQLPASACVQSQSYERLMFALDRSHVGILLSLDVFRQGH